MVECTILWSRVEVGDMLVNYGQSLVQDGIFLALVGIMTS